MQGRRGQRRRTTPKTTGPLDDRASTGVGGLDYLLRGGLPSHRIHLIEGHPGAGKTTLGMQFLLEGSKRGESCMYITLSETAEELRANAASHGWDLDGHPHAGGSTRRKPVGPKISTRSSTRRRLNWVISREASSRRSRQFKPARAVLDSVSDMRLLARDSLRYRRQILGLKQFFVGTRLHAAAAERNSGSDTDAHIQSLAHGVIRLEQTVHDFGIARRRLEITKLRGVAYVGGFHDFKIETGGLRVFPRLENRRQQPLSSKRDTEERPAAARRAARQRRADGHVHAVLGPSGVGKSTLGGHYLASAAKKGIHCAAFLFDEQRQTFLDRGDALGMNLTKYVEKRPSEAAKVEPGSMSPGEFSHHVRKAVEDDKVRVVLIDSLTGYLTAIPEADGGRCAPARAHVLSGELRRGHISDRCAAGHARAEHDVADRRQLHRRHDVHDALLRGRRAGPQGLVGT